MRPLGTGFIAVFGYSSKLKSKQAANKVKLQPKQQARRRRSRCRSFSQFASLVCCVFPSLLFLFVAHAALQSKFEVFPTQLDSSRFDSIRFFVRALDNPGISRRHTRSRKPKPTGKPKDTASPCAYRNIFDFSRILMALYLCVFVFISLCVCVFICIRICTERH